MATGAWITNRGKLLLMQGAWDDLGASVLKVGLCKVQGATADTEAEVQDLNTVEDLITTAGCTECDFTNYARKALVRSAASEDDTNNRVNMDAGDLTWTSAGGATNNDIYGLFTYDSTTDTSDTTRLLVSVDWFASPVATNGGDFTYAISDLFRAT